MTNRDIYDIINWTDKVREDTIMDIESLKVLVSVGGGIIGGVIGVLGYMRTKNKDNDEKTQKKVIVNAEQVRHDTTIDIKLDNIAKNIDEIRLDNKDFSKTINRFSERLGIAENDIKTVKGRVDDLEKLHTK